jgi:hypothetical protein
MVSAMTESQVDGSYHLFPVPLFCKPVKPLYYPPGDGFYLDVKQGLDFLPGSY